MAEIQIGARLESQAQPIDHADRLRILLIGDFGLPESNEITVFTRTTFADVLAAASPKVDAGIDDSDGNRIAFPVKTMDDFHPDTIFDQVAAFGRLRQLKRQLNMPAKADEAAKTIQDWLATDDTPTSDAPADSPSTTVTPPSTTSSADETATDGSLLDSVLSSTEAAGAASPSSTTAGPWSNLIREIVDGSRIQAITQSVKDAEKLLEQTMAHLMRRILAAAAFRAVEASWRSADFLIRRCRSNSVEFGILQQDSSELDEFCETGLTTEQAALLKLNEQVPGKQPWTILLPIAPDADDAAMLQAVQQWAAILGDNPNSTKLIFGTSAPGLQETLAIATSDGFTAVKNSPASSSICCAAPGSLLRLPYGDRQGRVEHFEFEEQLQPNPQQLLWGNAALLIAVAWIHNFEQGHAGGQGLTIENLPLHVYVESGATHLHPTCRYQLTQESASRLREAGVSPIIAYHEDDKALIPGIYSVKGAAW